VETFILKNPHGFGIVVFIVAVLTLPAFSRSGSLHSRAEALTTAAAGGNGERGAPQRLTRHS